MPSNISTVKRRLRRISKPHGRKVTLNFKGGGARRCCGPLKAQSLMADPIPFKGGAGNGSNDNAKPRRLQSEWRLHEVTAVSISDQGRLSKPTFIALMEQL